MYIVQYKLKNSDDWVFTLGDKERAINSLRGARNTYPNSEWRFVFNCEGHS